MLVRGFDWIVLSLMVGLVILAFPRSLRRHRFRGLGGWHRLRVLPAIAALAQQQGIKPPAIFVIGQVVARAAAPADSPTSRAWKL